MESISPLLLLTGALILVISVVLSIRNSFFLDYLPRGRKASAHILVSVHRGLMFFFIVGYVLLAKSVYDGTELSNLLVALICFFGAIFVLISLHLQHHLLTELRSLLHGVVPICSSCKKIRSSGESGDEEQTWETIETYISDRAHVAFSHGYCPACYEQAMAELKK